MARNIAADGGPVFRAVITSWPAGRSRTTWHEGPYASHGAARARITFWTNYLRDADTGKPYASGYVERTESTWRRLDDPAPVDTRTAALAEAADLAARLADEMREGGVEWPEEWSSREVRDAVAFVAAAIRTHAQQAKEPSK